MSLSRIFLSRSAKVLVASALAAGCASHRIAAIRVSLETSHPSERARPIDTLDPVARIFDPMIGVHDCVHRRTDYETGDTETSNARWTWEYEMGGHAVRDISDHGTPNVTLRVFDPDESLWHVHYFMGGERYYAGEWVGGPVGDHLIFKSSYQVGDRPVVSVLEYFNITDQGFDWRSTDVYQDTGEEFVDWTISCRKT